MWLESERRSRAWWWDDIDRLFSALPSPLFRQVKLLEYDLALRYSATGQFRDIFLGLDSYPILSIGPWLLDDLGVPAGPARDLAEGHVFRASLLLAARAQTIESIRDPGGFTTDDRIALVQWLSERASVEFARLLSPESPFWDRYEAIGRDDVGGLLDQWERQANAEGPDEPEAFLHNRFSGAALLVAAAALAMTHRDDSAPAVFEMLKEIDEAFEIRSDLASMHRDLQQGRPSYPILVVARAAGIPLRPRPKPEVILGAMVATDSLPSILEAVVLRLRNARRAALDLALPTFVSYLADVEADVEASLGDAALPGQPSARRTAGAARRVPPLQRSAPVLPTAIAMAQGFLLADPSFRESWETHREGMLGLPEVASRFPAGLVMEILNRHGRDVRRSVDDFLAFTLANGFRYFDDARSGIDSDTVGVYLRLLPHANANHAKAEGLTEVLDCLERNVQATGVIPVWITGCAGSGDDWPDVIALGEGCATVAAHLLLGLTLASRDDRYEVITRGTRSLLDRINEVGLGANVNYPPEYALGIFLRLLRHLESQPPGRRQVRRADQAGRALLSELVIRSEAGPRTAQEAALLMLACFEANREDLINATWVMWVLKHQRFDGSWVGEPFAAAPNRGRSVSWYSSTLLTSALCYDALARYAIQQARADN